MNKIKVKPVQWKKMFANQTQKIQNVYNSTVNKYQFEKDKNILIDISPKGKKKDAHKSANLHANWCLAVVVIDGWIKTIKNHITRIMNIKKQTGFITLLDNPESSTFDICAKALKNRYSNKIVQVPAVLIITKRREQLYLWTDEWNKQTMIYLYGETSCSYKKEWNTDWFCNLDIPWKTYERN